MVRVFSVRQNFNQNKTMKFSMLRGLLNIMEYYELYYY